MLSNITVNLDGQPGMKNSHNISIVLFVVILIFGVSACTEEKPKSTASKKLGIELDPILIEVNRLVAGLDVTVRLNKITNCMLANSYSGLQGEADKKSDFPTVNAFQASFAGPTFPVAQCQDVAVSTDLGLCSSNASVDAGSSDPNGGTVTLSQAPPGPYLLGDTDVTLAVTNGQGLSASCLATVTALDQEPPIIECPAPQVECTGPAGTTATFNPTVTDNCPGSTASCTPSSGSAFPLAITPGSCTATDSTLNASTCDFTVTVVDTTAPTVTAALVPVRVNPRKQIGRFRVEFSCSDICDASALPSAELNGIAVANGQDIKLKVSDKTKVELNEAGNLVKLEAPTFSLVATCADASANVGIATATPDFGP